jgi:uncharacterized membrane protein
MVGAQTHEGYACEDCTLNMTRETYEQGRKPDLQFCPRCTCQQSGKRGGTVVGHFIHRVDFNNGKCYYCEGELVEFTDQETVQGVDLLIKPQTKKDSSLE